MTFLVAIDPGLRACGVAVFGELKTLVHAKWVKNPAAKGLHGPALHLKMAEAVGQQLRKWNVLSVSNKLVLEYPRIYPGSGQQKGDLNDIVELGGVDSALAAWLLPEELKVVYPADWKGQVPKDIMTARIRSRLSLLELSVMENTDHNTFDAVGIGLHTLGRMVK